MTEIALLFFHSARSERLTFSTTTRDELNAKTQHTAAAVSNAYRVLNPNAQSPAVKIAGRFYARNKCRLPEPSVIVGLYRVFRESYICTCVYVCKQTATEFSRSRHSALPRVNRLNFARSFRQHV